MLGYSVLVSVVSCVVALTNHSSSDDIYLIQNIKLDVHHVVTTDLYILEVHRLQNVQKDIKKKKHSVLLFHGLLESSDRFVEHGRELSLAYSLADAGFDVWLGNNRGNKYSRHHIYLNPDDPVEELKFFNYTFEDIGVNDVAAIVDFILDETKTKQLHYIGHSQGGSVFFALNTLQPSYNDKFLTANLLAGAGYQEYFADPTLKILSQISDFIYTLLEALGFVEIFSPLLSANQFSNITREEMVDHCFGDKSLKQLCQTLNETEIIRIYGVVQGLSKNGTFMGGGAVKQLAHFGQNIRSGIFRRWDYGANRNLQVYGTKEPPPYNLSLITVETTLHYGMTDHLVNAKDVINMAQDMRKAFARKVAKANFGHSDFLDAPDAKELVYDFIINALLYFEGGEKRTPRNIRKKIPFYLSVQNALDLAHVDEKNFTMTHSTDSSITKILPYTTTDPNLSTINAVDSLERNNSDLFNASSQDSLSKNSRHLSTTKVFISLPKKNTVKLDLIFQDPEAENEFLDSVPENSTTLSTTETTDTPDASTNNTLTKSLLIIVFLATKMI